jgi:two-component system cell cycle sensor histidine kinase/response regulator CckA
MSIKAPLWGEESTLDALLEGFQILDHGLRYVYLNRAAAEHARADRGALLGRRMVDCYPGIEHTELFQQLNHCLTQREAKVMENEFQYPDGSKATFELRIQPVPDGICVLSLDISARKRAERELRERDERAYQVGRMESLGQLAAGVAHDFNNLLSVIMGFAEIAQSRPRGAESGDLEGIVDAARRASALTTQLLSYARRQVLRAERVDMNDLVARVCTMLRRVFNPRIELHFEPSPQLPSIEADPVKLEQVLMNLLLNARDALPKGGSIRVGLAATELSADAVEAHPGLAPGPYLSLWVADNGVGMDYATQQRVFEPFFSTKGAAQGTGLGLASVYGIVKQSGGDVWLQSAPERGTTFYVLLPQSPEAAADARPSLLPPRARPSQGQLVLVAEEDAVLRRFAESALTEAGHRVIVASSGAQALELCAAQPVALLVTDLAMSGGVKLIQFGKEARPGLKVLCTSGASAEEQRALPSDVKFLEKPYLPSVLVQTVQRMLAG